MDYLTQAKTALYRATDTQDLKEKEAHLKMAASMLEVALAAVPDGAINPEVKATKEALDRQLKR
jgi:hypothetical protein